MPVPAWPDASALTFEHLLCQYDKMFYHKTRPKPSLVLAAMPDYMKPRLELLMNLRIFILQCVHLLEIETSWIQIIGMANGYKKRQAS